jgi:hypothetical protein
LLAVGAYGGAQVVREPRQAQAGLQHGGWDSVRTYRGQEQPLEALVMGVAMARGARGGGPSAVERPEGLPVAMSSTAVESLHAGPRSSTSAEHTIGPKSRCPTRAAINPRNAEAEKWRKSECTGSGRYTS